MKVIKSNINPKITKADEKALSPALFPLCSFVIYFVILCGSMFKF
jgi:hypothetical protein